MNQAQQQISKMAAPYDNRESYFQNFRNTQQNNPGDFFNNTNQYAMPNQQFNHPDAGFVSNRPNLLAPYNVGNMRFPPPPINTFGQQRLNHPPPGPRFNPSPRHFDVTRFSPRDNFQAGRFGPPQGLQMTPGNDTGQDFPKHQMQLPQPTLRFQSPPPQSEMIKHQKYLTETPSTAPQNELHDGLNMHFIKQKQSEDAKWIEDFVNSRKGQVDKERKPSINISEFQVKTRHMMVLLARLQKHRQILETMKEEDSSIWEQKLKEVTKLKVELEAVQREVMNPGNAAVIQRKIKKRKQKRARVKRLRQERYKEQQAELCAIEEKHAKIDKDMQQIIEKQKQKKQEEDMQKEADGILGQVRKKIAETNRTLQLIEGLKKLRSLRADRLERQGVLNMYESQGGSSARKLMFEAKLSNSLDLLNKQMTTYKAEESTLKVLLETEQQETREKEQEQARLRLAEKAKQEQQMYDKMLFGNEKKAQPGDPLYPFRQFYDSASHSLEDLISIRRDWDMFLVVPETMGASCIPDHFVHPAEPSSDVWASALSSPSSHHTKSS